MATGAVRAIVLTHVPPAFCAGADLKERAAGVPDSRPIVRAFTRLMDADVPTIAAVKGPVRAGGIGLMASCDLVVVHRDVGFALTEVRIGVAAAIISVPILRRASGSRLAAAFLTGEPFDAVRRPGGRVGHPRRRRCRRHRRRAVRRHPDGRPGGGAGDQAPPPRGARATA